jgi:hypothetical protein
MKEDFLVRSLKILLLAALLAVIGVGVIQAQGSENGVPIFSDGRVNNWQIDAPVAVYCVFDHTQDVNVGVFQQISIWGLNSNELLHATAADIAAAQANFSKVSTASTRSKVATTTSTMATLDSADGYTLSLLQNGSFQVSAPNGYTFNWTRGDTDC